MQSNEFGEYLKDRYQHQVNWYDKRSELNQIIYGVLKCTTIVLSLSVPIVIALSYDSSRVGIIVLSSIVAVLTALLGTFKFYENWINYRTTCESMKREKYYFDFSLGIYQDSSNKEGLFVKRIEGLLTREHTAWLATKEESEKGK
jgi:hypothetical protein